MKENNSSIEKLELNDEVLNEIKLENGLTVKLSITFAKLNVLKSLNNQLYQRFNKVFYLGKSEDIFDLITVLYVAYWCANYSINNQENFLSEKEFTDLVPYDISLILKIFNNLTQPKKK